jgi:hypothetical protein
MSSDIGVKIPSSFSPAIEREEGRSRSVTGGTRGAPGRVVETLERHRLENHVGKRRGGRHPFGPRGGANAHANVEVTSAVAEEQCTDCRYCNNEAHGSERSPNKRYPYKRHPNEQPEATSEIHTAQTIPDTGPQTRFLAVRVRLARAHHPRQPIGRGGSSTDFWRSVSGNDAG